MSWWNAWNLIDLCLWLDNPVRSCHPCMYRFKFQAARIRIKELGLVLKW